MNDQAYVRLVHAHAKGIRGYEHVDLSRGVCFLSLRPTGTRTTGMISPHAVTSEFQKLKDGIDLASCGAVHNGATGVSFSQVASFQQVKQSCLLVCVGRSIFDGIRKVRTIETLLHESEILEIQGPGDVLLHSFGSGGRQSNNRNRLIR